jgi:hypothetical protein
MERRVTFIHGLQIVEDIEESTTIEDKNTMFLLVLVIRKYNPTTRIRCDVITIP